MNNKFFVGTSGWSYKGWKGKFYPENLKTIEYLKFYSEHFKATEINTSFYNLPKAQTVINWAEATEPPFLFCPKISRYITHMKKLKDVEKPLEKFFSVFDLIHHRLGPILVQLPPSVAFIREKTEFFFDILKTQYSNYEFVLEARNESWFAKESLELLEKNNIALVISQSGNIFPYFEAMTSNNVYLRFHGPKELFSSKYSNAMLQKYAEKCIGWMREGKIVYAFFNNDNGGYAVEDAAVFNKMLDEG
jgi:uncharacterized protein YecE (DUF72 family)